VSRRILITCSRTWQDWGRARRVLAQARQLAPGAVLVSGHAIRGDQDLERIWRGLGGQAEEYPPDWEGECAPDCWPPYHRKRGKNGRDYCPAAGDRRNKLMAELPDVIACLAFLAPCAKPDCSWGRDHGPHYTHGALRCASYAEYEMKIPTKRIKVPIPGQRPPAFVFEGEPPF
jgi:hypothetical protein